MTTTPLPSRPPIDDRAERILAAALEEFTRRGYAGAREGVIARRAGVSLATLRLYFGSKEDLFREVVRSSIVTGLGEDAWGSTPAAAGPTRALLREFVHRFWRAMDRPDQAALLRLSLGELPRFPELAVFHATQVFGRDAGRLERILAEGMSRGEIRVRDPRTVARVILSALITHSHWFANPAIYAGLIGPDRAQAEAAVIAAIEGAVRAA
jgi:AcrR family transcriptional regulator